MVTLLARHLDRERFDVQVWALDEGGDNERRLREAGVPVEVLHKGRGVRWSFLRSLRARVRETRPDVIHAHNTPAARWAALASVGVAPRPVLVRTEHTFNPRSASSTCSLTRSWGRGTLPSSASPSRSPSATGDAIPCGERAT